jgi:hypothetical protein
MSAKRITMRKIRDVLRLRFAAGLSIRQIKASTKVSVGAIQKLLARAEEEGLAWPLPPKLDDESRLAHLFYPGADTRVSTRYEMPDWPALHQALKGKGITKQLLWEEYTEQYPNRCYSYSQFCERYAHWKGLQRRSMRQTHKAGEKCFVDYAGQTVPIISAETGEIREAQIFVAVLGASNYTYAEASLTQSLPDWLASHVRAFEYFCGTTAIVVPDYVPGNIIWVMWPAPLCGQWRLLAGLQWRAAGVWPHNVSEGIQPIEQGFVVLPGGASGGYRRNTRTDLAGP